MNQHQIIIVQYDSKYAEQTVKMWRNSKERAIGQKESHSLKSHIYFLNHILPGQFQIDLALIDERVVGMIAYNETEISQLYVHIDYQGIGIGQILLNKVKAQSSGKLSLYTFEVNKNAQRFYEKNGFKIIGRGYENEEKLPDIQYEWNIEINDVNLMRS
ncbi:GNAT family N-acetyltransferase [Neobacillus sp. OS1-33]|uniref:GNAT family N-acetyltransferase n=1 Tax=Neobacillus sp. OS1-33 TaxID=3070683 RepID=UPI0027E09FF8|nr:GNAT family N-acetyltransferase [Neobacillus sp. OS1-33]WML26263.1 GNAT family N-acetyltransferase [Neobacillus sp. OS1-33]